MPNYYITGLMFQDFRNFNLARLSGVFGMPVEEMLEKISRISFSGWIFTDPEKPSSFVGAMTDLWGQSEIFDVIINQNTLSFFKKYLNRPDKIHYSFEKKNEIWCGGFRGSDGIVGRANCVIGEVPVDFFHPQETN